MDGPSALAWLTSRRSVRAFDSRPVPRAALKRLVEAATTAPSSTNRQPWRFAVVTAPGLRRAVAEAVRARSDEMKDVIRSGHHGDDFRDYSDFFHEPLAGAAAIVVPQYRVYPDLIASFLAASGAPPGRFETPAAMQAELCGVSAAVMALLLQAHAEGLGACWMAGPMVARAEVSELCGVRDPWRMVGAVAVGYPAAPPPEAPARRPIDRVVTWLDQDTGPDGAASGSKPRARGAGTEGGHP
jgi:nitroreductase